MAKVILGTTISLDGLINGRSSSVDALYSDLADWRETELGKESIQNTGAVVMGRNSYAMAEDPDWYAGNYEYRVPIFVLTYHVPEKKPKETDTLTLTFVAEGLESTIRHAKDSAGDKDVNIIPVLLAGGLRLFENIDTDLIQLERIKVVELPCGRTHLRFRFVK